MQSSYSKDQTPVPWREGWYFQAGYLFIGIDLEPVVRYEQYNQDTKVIEKTEKVWTIGANLCTKGHSLKISANWIHS